MNKKNGFTLVELMVVIVIIGVLAAVAIPKMMAATNKAKAGEGPQFLGSISRLQHAFKAEYNAYILATQDNKADGANTLPLDENWAALGMDKNPFSRYFDFAVAGSAGAAVVNFPVDNAAVNALDDFTATATLISKLGDATTGMTITIDDNDNKVASARELNLLVGSFGASVASQDP